MYRDLCGWSGPFRSRSSIGGREGIFDVHGTIQRSRASIWVRGSAAGHVPASPFVGRSGHIPPSRSASRAFSLLLLALGAFPCPARHGGVRHISPECQPSPRSSRSTGYAAHDYNGQPGRRLVAPMPPTTRIDRLGTDPCHPRLESPVRVRSAPLLGRWRRWWHRTPNVAARASAGGGPPHQARGAKSNHARSVVSAASEGTVRRGTDVGHLREHLAQIDRADDGDGRSR